MDPEQNQQAIKAGNTRISELDVIRKDPSASPIARADATRAKEKLQQEVTLRKQVADAKIPAAQKKAESALAGFRAKNCPSADDGSTIAKCQLPAVYVHIHMRFLLPTRLLREMRDASVYPFRAANVPEAVFKAQMSFEGMAISDRNRWNGHHPVVGATVTMAGQTVVTDATGTAKFVNVGGGSYTLGIEPPPNQKTTKPAGPEIPVQTGYDYATAPRYNYRPFQVKASLDGEGRWRQKPEATAVLPYQGDSAAYASVVGTAAMDLYLDWKPDWLKVKNHGAATGRTNQAVVLHQTGTFGHEQIGSPISMFDGAADTSAHYLVDLDGHVVKLVDEANGAGHAAANKKSHWHELVDLNYCGIGIEIVHTDQNVKNGPTFFREFTREQYDAINQLLVKFKDAFGITKHYVCGHADCRDDDRDCPGDMFDWASLERAGNAMKIGGAGFADSRVVTPSAQTAPEVSVPLSQRLFDIGYTHKKVQEALTRFIRRAWSGSRLAGRPTATLEAVPPAPVPKAAATPAPKAPKKPAKPVPALKQVVQPVADAIDQMFKDI